MRIVTFPWTRYGTDDILVRKVRKGCPEAAIRHLDPDGCLVQQRKHRTWRMCGKGDRQHEADTAKHRLADGGNFVKERVAGRSSFS